MFVAAALRKLGHTFQAQARAAGYTCRNFYLKVREDWAKWPIGRVEGWLSVAGIDLWQFRLPKGIPKWDPDSDRPALVALLGSSKDADLRRLAKELNGQMDS